MNIQVKIEINKKKNDVMMNVLAWFGQKKTQQRSSHDVGVNK